VPTDCSCPSTPVASSADSHISVASAGAASLSTPLCAALIGDRDGFFHHRTGNANPLLYQLFGTGYGFYFHDITGFGQSTNNNGLFPVTPGYDMATGLDTPNMSTIIVGSF
jgi:subtilase family serine protease